MFAMLITSKGTNTLKPHAALKPIPIQTLNRISIIELLLSYKDKTTWKSNSKTSQKSQTKAASAIQGDSEARNFFGICFFGSGVFIFSYTSPSTAPGQ